MADLPRDRVGSAPPFNCARVDYIGPYLIKRAQKEIMVYEYTWLLKQLVLKKTVKKNNIFIINHDNFRMHKSGLFVMI